MHRGGCYLDIALRLPYCSFLGVAPLGARLPQRLSHHTTPNRHIWLEDCLIETFSINLGHLMNFLLSKEKQRSVSVRRLAFRIDCGQWVVEFVCGLEDRERVGIGWCSKLTPLGGKVLTEVHKENEGQRTQQGHWAPAWQRHASPRKQINSRSKIKQ